MHQGSVLPENKPNKIQLIPATKLEQRTQQTRTCLKVDLHRSLCRYMCVLSIPSGRDSRELPFFKQKPTEKAVNSLLAELHTTISSTEPPRTA